MFVFGQVTYDRRERILQRSTSQGSIGSPVYNRHGYTPTLSRSPQHFHRPGEYQVCVCAWMCLRVCVHGCVCACVFVSVVAIKSDCRVFIRCIGELFTCQLDDSC